MRRSSRAFLRVIGGVGDLQRADRLLFVKISYAFQR